MGSGFMECYEYWGKGAMGGLAAAKNEAEPLLWIGPGLQGGKPLGLQVLLYLLQVEFAGNFPTDTFPLG